jgi:hypothetical protein
VTGGWAEGGGGGRGRLGKEKEEEKRKGGRRWRCSAAYPAARLRTLWRPSNHLCPRCATRVTSSGRSTQRQRGPALRLDLPRPSAWHALYHCSRGSQCPPQQLSATRLSAAAGVASVHFGRLRALHAVNVQQQRRRRSCAGRGWQRARLAVRLQVEGARLLLVLQCSPVPPRQQGRHVSHTTRRCLKLRPPPPYRRGTPPAGEPLRARLKARRVLILRHTAVASLGWRVAAAAATPAAATHAVVVQLMLARASATHGQVGEAAARAPTHAARDLLRLQLPPSVRAIAVLAQAARRRPDVVAVDACDGGLTR